jgi:transcriptional regulator with XRE-family HTH domain
MSDGSVKSVYELSHIHPVKGVKKQIGLLHPLNLVIADKSFNRSRKTNYTTGGLYLAGPPQSKFKCSEDTPSAKVLALIAEFLGASLADFLAKAKLTKSTRHQQITRLVNLKAKEAPSTSEQELAAYESQLKRLSKADLAAAVEASGATIWKGDRNTASAVLVALGELKRLQPDSSLVKVLEHIELNLPGFESGATTLGLDCTDQSACLSFVLEQCWLCLHHDKYSLIYNGKHLLELLIDAVEIPGGIWF